MKKKTGCNCIDQVISLLGAQGLKLHFAVRLSGEGIVELGLSKANPRSGGGKRPPVMLATYCPFCGKKYAEGGPILTASPRKTRG